MKRYLAGALAGATLVAALFVFVVTFAQDIDSWNLIRPLVVDIRQSVPVVADVIVPLDDGTSITTTIPLTLDIALQVAVSGVVSESVQVVEREPEITIVEPTPVPPSDSVVVEQEEELIYDDLRWTVVNAQNVGSEYDDSEDNFRGLTTHNAFVVVNFSVENTANVPRNVEYGFEYGYAYSITLHDAEDRQFDPFRYGHVPDECSSLDLNPGLSTPCTILFEIPKDTTGFSVVFTIENGNEQSVELGF